MGRSGAIARSGAPWRPFASLCCRATAELFLVLGVVFGLLACADKRPAPIEDRSRPGSLRADERYTVLRGDTLYAIAFRYGLDFRRLAAANNIASPYTIFPGQELKLQEADPPRRTPSSSTASASKRSTPAKPATVATTQSPTTSKPQPAAPSTGAVAAANRPPAQRETTSSTDPEQAVTRWRWPADGPVVRRFDGTLNKGIDIAGERGDDIAATAGGRVVYAGSGIAGYGLLAIVRHNEEYLSAYGHNDALLVAEGDVVRPGQVIARRGSSGTDIVKLHFEIRRRGRPVDPLTRLPKR